ncbi:hypothetical protein [Gulosibacter bifidus]|uniref:DUF2157 domain-containing protein n=1 Tax=Gulosibacter bifidus TaxID=272239 RepID=A0ABW5RK59_9MICO|nr:hypothetical protein [Gulosibacter bifidus]
MQPNSPAPLQGAGAEWMRETVWHLQQHRLPPEQIQRTISFVEHTCATTQSSPRMQFGAPNDFAAKVAGRDANMPPSRGHVIAEALGATHVHYLGIVCTFVGIFGAAVFALTARSLIEGTVGDTLPFLLSPLVALIGILAFVIGLTKLPVPWMLAHAGWLVAFGMVYCIGLVVLAALWHYAPFSLPTTAVMWTGAAFGAGSSIAMIIAGRRARSRGQKHMSTELISTALILPFLAVMLMILPGFD